jgi:glutaconate CoA-transferase subunit B
VIGNYAHPRVRLPGAGGAPEIASYAHEVLIVMKQSTRSFVAQLDFRTSCGYLGGGDAGAAGRSSGAGPKAVITDFGVLRPNPRTLELELAALYQRVSVEAARAATGWPLEVAQRLEVVPPPDTRELEVLRDLHARTEAAHAAAVRIKLPS